MPTLDQRCLVVHWRNHMFTSIFGTMMSLRLTWMHLNSSFRMKASSQLLRLRLQRISGYNPHSWFLQISRYRNQTSVLVISFIPKCIIHLGTNFTSNSAIITRLLPSSIGVPKKCTCGIFKASVRRTWENAGRSNEITPSRFFPNCSLNLH